MGDEISQPAKPRISRRGRGSTTLADVAREAGVSPMTVSRVVNGEPNVVAETRQKVQAIIRSLSYVPNPAARSLAGGHQLRIALLHSNPSAAYLSELLLGSLAEAGACNVELTLEPCFGAEKAAVLVARLVNHRIDAVLLPPPLCEDPALLQALQDAAMPMVQIATGKTALFAHAVSIDDEAAAHAMTVRLIGQGHRRIGFIAGDSNQTSSGLRRLGYERALSEADIALDPSLIAAGDFTYRSGLAAAERLLTCEHPPTAIFASNDDMAAASLAVAHKFGLDVPRDLSICGFDDTAMATTIWPELTTIRQPIAEMAQQAIRMLTEAARARLSGQEDAPRKELFDFALISRGSDGAPPRS